MLDQWNALKSKDFIRSKTDLFFHLFSIVQKQWCSLLALSFRALSRIKNLVPDLGFITSAFQGKNKRTLLVIVIVTVVFALVGYFAKKVFEPAQMDASDPRSLISTITKSESPVQPNVKGDTAVEKIVLNDTEALNTQASQLSIDFDQVAVSEHYD